MTHTTKLLLAAGIIAGPIFVVVPLIQMLTRDGFDITRHPISALSLGELGWIQISTFILTGMLAVACAVGVRRVLVGGPGGTWGPLLIGAFGVGVIAAGIFPTDPAYGFPPGTPEGKAETMSWHAILHSVAFFLAFTSLPAACFVFARQFGSLGRKRWANYSLATGVTTPVFIALGMGSVIAAGVAFYISGLAAWVWVVAIAMRLLAQESRKEATARTVQTINLYDAGTLAR